ncbi:prepilin peptidase [Nocardia mexicana]|uniref:Leader peptidase (Prepilin peptidase)/N-methyltransferase n=1 Tax=Nocardia mexicana TaxID=279262 RepID=A0A370H8L7_9NOCA|nr:prepilin peptidase [Nocardia mexicana]RDI50681.1 leader peptidase (prepilin peptidase)/N-methyltransferase [Nocardia mexicana]
MTTVAFGLLAVWCALLSAVDLRERRLPDPLTGSGAVAVLGYALAADRFAAALAGALLLSVPYLVIHLASPAAFGAGDVKLAVGLGAAAACGGGQAWAWAAIGAPLLTAVAGLVALALPLSRAGPARRAVPHGPSMCLSTLLALLLAG